MAIAFFDLDKTLIAKNSAILWIRAELRAGHMNRRTALWGLGWIIRYQLGAADMEQVLRNAVKLMTGLREGDLLRRTHAFYERDIRHTFRPGALAAVAAHRAAGDRLVILTTSSNYLSERVCAELQLDDSLCNRFEVDQEGRYTGRPVEPLCFGPGKRTLAERYVRRHGARLADCTFYSDSASDLPMLEAAGVAVAVNPDPRLRRTARRRGWRVVDWGEPAP